MLWTSQIDQYFLLDIKKCCNSKFTGLSFWRQSPMTRFALLKSCSALLEVNGIQDRMRISVFRE